MTIYKSNAVLALNTFFLPSENHDFVTGCRLFYVGFVVPNYVVVFRPIVIDLSNLHPVK